MYRSTCIVRSVIRPVLPLVSLHTYILNLLTRLPSFTKTEEKKAFLLKFLLASDTNVDCRRCDSEKNGRHFGKIGLHPGEAWIR